MDGQFRGTGGKSNEEPIEQVDEAKDGLEGIWTALPTPNSYMRALLFNSDAGHLRLKAITSTPGSNFTPSFCGAELIDAKLFLLGGSTMQEEKDAVDGCELPMSNVEL